MAGLYELRAIAGSGAQAVVCVARTRALGEEVALKVLRPQLLGDVAVVARFTDEARLLLPVHHPGVVRVHRLLDYAGTPVIEMERVEGVSVRRLLPAQGRGLPLEVAVEIALRVAHTLSAVHDGPYGRDGQPMHVVHRDVKPENLLLDRHGHVKLVDFGTARGTFDGRRARSLYVVQGSAGYEPPERRQGQTEHQGIDVYALGVTLFQLITGAPLLLPRGRDPARDALERQVAHLPEEPLRAVVRAMVSWAPDDRPDLARTAELLAQLRRDLCLRPDLPAFAASVVPAQLAAGSASSAAGELDALRFLETDLPTHFPTALAPGAAEAAVRQHLASPSWERRWSELEAIVSAAVDPGFQAPLLEVLDRGCRPWWAPFRRTSTPEQLVCALWVLGDHPTEAVRERARPLLAHREGRVRRAARFVLGLDDRAGADLRG